MKRIVRLTESDLTKLLRRILSETEENIQTKNTDPSTSKGGFVMIFAFPNYEIKGYGGESTLKKVSRTIHGGGSQGSYGKLGHGGVILVNSLGNVDVFEFGRYGTKTGYGKVIHKSAGKVGKIGWKKGWFSDRIQLLNPEEVAKAARNVSTGPSYKMMVASVYVPNYIGSYKKADLKGEFKYNEIDVFEGGGMNCGTFANEVANAGGITNIDPISGVYPSDVVKEFYYYSDNYFTIDGK
jgi:hypothetical protein